MKHFWNEKSVGDSVIYSKEEIESAMDVVTSYFKEEFDGCTVIELSYDVAISSDSSVEWAKLYGEEEAIVLV